MRTLLKLLPLLAALAGVSMLALLFLALRHRTNDSIENTLSDQESIRAPLRISPDSEIKTYRGNFQRTGLFHSKGPESFKDILWRFKADDIILSTPVIANGMIFFGCFDGNFYSLDISSGQQIWTFTTRAAIRSSPTISHNLVIFGSNDHNLYSVDLTTGAEIWRYESSGPIYCSPCVYSNDVYFVSFDGCIFALDIIHGYQKWKCQLRTRVHSSPSIYSRFLYVGSEIGLHAFDLPNEDLKWFKETNHRVSTTPVSLEQSIFFGTVDGSFHSLDSRSGATSWQTRFGRAIPNPPAIDREVIYVGGYDSFLYALNKDTGKVKWTFHAESMINCSPAVSGGIVYFCDNNNVYAIDKNGSLLSKYPTGLALLSVIPYGGSIFLVGNNYLDRCGHRSGYILAIK